LRLLVGEASNVVDEIEALYGSDASRRNKRHTDFLNRRFGGSWDNVLEAARDTFYSSDPSISVPRGQVYRLEETFEMTDSMLDDAALAFVEVLRRRVALEA
jgi:hypothetical protein